MISAIIICDHVYRDKATNKCVLSGTFSSILSKAFPTRHGNMGIYVSITDVPEKGRVRAIIKHHDDEKKLIELPSWEIQNLPERSTTLELCGNISGIVFEKEGGHDISIYWNDQFLCSRQINLVKF